MSSKDTWSVLEAGRWILKYASLWSYSPKRKPPKRSRKVISVDYREHELRVLALLEAEGKDTSMISQVVIPDPPAR